MPVAFSFSIKNFTLISEFAVRVTDPTHLTELDFANTIMFYEHKSLYNSTLCKISACSLSVCRWKKNIFCLGNCSPTRLVYLFFYCVILLCNSYTNTDEFIEFHGVIPHPTQYWREAIRACLTKPLLSDSARKYQGYLSTDVSGSPSLTLKIHFWTFKGLRSVWVADAASFHGRWMSIRVHFSAWI
jgi:hypothetical protein